MSYKEDIDRRVSELFGDVPGSTWQPEIAFTDENYPEDTFDIVEFMKGAKDPNTGMIRDLRIDDRDIPEAKNYYDFAHQIIGKDAHPPWFIQMWVGIMLFAEYCPCCSNPKWTRLEWVIEHIDRAKPSSEIKEGLKLLRNGRCPKCKRHKWELIKDYGLRNYLELVNVLGQRSGKSASAASYSAYITHRYLKFPRLAELSPAMQKSTELTGTFVSLSFVKAASLLWTPYITIIKDSSWFTQYHELLTYYQNKYGTELFRVRDQYLTYYNKNMRFYPLGPNSKTLRGDTRVLGVIDELGLFPLPTGNDEEDEQSERANADEAHKSLSNSLTTVQAVQVQLLKQELNPPPGILMGVSSPISMRDKVMRLLGDSRTDEGKKHILGVNLPTWKVNPFLERESGQIALAYQRNAEKAERDFGATPPRVANTFMKASQISKKLWVVKNTHSIKYYYDQPGELYAKVIKHYATKYPSVVTLDAGHSNNSFVLTGGHFDFEAQKTKVTTLIELMTHDGRKIDFNRTYENVILPVMKDLNCVCLFADQWQSLDILSRAKADMGEATWAKGPRCLAKQYSPKLADFKVLVSMMENMSIELPFLAESDYDEICQFTGDYRTLNGQVVKHLLLQMLTVMDKGEVMAPTKGAGFTDDIFRALVLQTLIHKDKVFERLKAADVVVKQEKRAMPVPIVVGRSGMLRR